MSLRWRPMRPKDVPECAAIVAAHPVIAPRYGREIGSLVSVWRSLLGRDAMTTAVFEDVQETRATILGFGVGVFVSDAFVREIKTAPLFWFGPELAKRTIAGDSPVLTDREVRDANSGDGLNELVWETVTWPMFASRSDLYHMIGNAYIDVHRGYRFKEMITTQAESPARLQWAVDAGGLYWDPGTQRYTKSLSAGAETFIMKPHIVGITRESELARLGSWVGTLFDHRAPQIGFTRAEQQLLLGALRGEGATDPELAKAFRLSVPTVKKTWRSIYQRVALRMPDLIPASAQPETGRAERGKEKRRRLLVYLRDHPEELRPISTKTLMCSRRPPKGA